MRIISINVDRTIQELKKRKIEYRKYDKIMHTEKNKILLYKTLENNERELLEITLD